MMREASEEQGEKVWRQLVETLLSPGWAGVHGDRPTAEKAQVLVYEQVEASFG